jgi:hypothetical protein
MSANKPRATVKAREVKAREVKAREGKAREGTLEVRGCFCGW